MRELTRAQCLEIRQYTAGVIAAREEYAAHPTVAIEEDWCVECCYPRSERRCQVCRDHLAAMRRMKRARGKVAGDSVVEVVDEP